ncbi:MAG TPA: putative manganese-dependent inorganic diphosphatase [Chloroflexia bacterium]|nr:putative manganese-dependent inorganic diphosphatase [Chloroflexia bacterium]
MQPQPAIYVLGHKNPDSDAICSAVGYTALLHAQGRTNAIAARQGDLRPETAYILERFGVPVPLLVTDVRPRVADVMTSPALTIHEETSLYEVGQMLQREGVRAVAVIEDSGRLCGIIGIEDFARSFISGLDLDQLDHVPLNLDNVLRALGGRLLVDAPGRTLRDRAMVGAMEIDTMLKRIAPDILLVMGDREDAQRAAIEFGVGALVITGDTPVSEEILELAREHQVTVISVAHHTYTTVRLIHMSTSIRHVMRREVITCYPDDLVDEVRETLQTGRVRALVVVDEQRKVLGIISRTNLLRQVRRQVVLVDHNERSQSVAGIEEADVIGVIDHHRVADFQTRSPAFMRMEPVGATSTIVAKLFMEAGLAIPQPVAGVLLSGILTDTLLFRGPTTTAEDRRVAEILAGRAGVDVQELGARILNLASDVSDRSPDQIIMSDFKEFRVDGANFGVGVFETANGEEVLSRRAELLDAMSRLQAQQGYTSVLFSVIDIIREYTVILSVGHPDALAETFSAPLEDGTSIKLQGILSRKKHIVPLLSSLAQRVNSTPHRV